jgi:hypothetical protein
VPYSWPFGYLARVMHGQKLSGILLGVMGGWGLVNCGGPSQPATTADAQPGGPTGASAASAGEAAPEGPELRGAKAGGARAESAGRDEGEADLAATEPKPADLIGLVCEKTCQRVEKNCSAKEAKFCRASCRDYVSGAEHCPVEIHGALSCQQDAEDFRLCANISDEACVPLFRKMIDCRTGKVPPRVWGDMSREAKADHGKGLHPLKLSGYSMTQLMPEGTQVDAGPPFKANKSNGAGRFVIEAVPLEGKTLSSASMLRTVTKYVGVACQPKLRLHGRFESGHVVHSRFDTTCKDGTEYHGLAHFWPDRALMVAHVGPASAALEEGPRDAFLFGFKVIE